MRERTTTQLSGNQTKPNPSLSPSLRKPLLSSLMAASWVKSLQCKSNALEDVYTPSPKHLNHLLSSSSCRKSVQNLKDVVDTTKKKTPSSHSSSSPKPTSRHHSKPSNPDSKPATRIRTRHSDPFFPTLTELPEQHPSHNVVQIIFHTSWSNVNSFPGRIEMVLKVHNPAKTVTRFEEYRDSVKSRSREVSVSGDDGRCMADGNEVMRFFCVGPTAGAVYDLRGLCEFSSKNRAICTFSGSGKAHESVDGGKGRRAMLVCRVIAGRVCKRLGVESFLEGRVGFDSVSGDNGELFVFDARAVLPCFLVIYKP